MFSSKQKLSLLLLRTRRQNKALLKTQSAPSAICAFVAGLLVLCEHHHHHHHLCPTRHGPVVVEEHRAVLGATQTHHLQVTGTSSALSHALSSQEAVNRTPFLAVTKLGTWMFSVDKSQLCWLSSCFQKTVHQ